MRHQLPETVNPVIVPHIKDLEAMVLNDTLLAGLISGRPTPPLEYFGCQVVSAQAMLTCKASECIDLGMALDSAVSRALGNGTMATVTEQYPGFDSIEVHTCRTSDLDMIPFPTNITGRLRDAIARGFVRVAALGPYNWGDSGDYTKTPHLGAFPDIYSAIEHHIRKQYGIVFKRVFYGTSTEVLDAVATGDADTTEPYWIVDSFYKSQPRKWNFNVGCLVRGFEANYIVKPTDSSGDEFAVFQYAIVVLATVCLIIFVFVGVMVYFERKKKPLFGVKRLIEPCDKTIL